MSLKVQTKLLLLTIIPILAALVIALLGGAALRTVTATSGQLIEDRLRPVVQLNQIGQMYREGVVDLAHKTRAQMLFWGEAGTALEDARENIGHSWELYRQGQLSQQEQAVITQYAGAIEQAKASMEKLSAFIEQRSSYALGNYVDLELYQEVEPVLLLIEALVGVQAGLAKDAVIEAEAISAEANVLLVLVVGALILSVALLGWWLNLGISRPLKHMLRIITEIEQSKNLSIKANMQVNDEFGVMGDSFDRMMAETGQLILQLQSLGQTLSASASSLVEDSEKNERQSQQQTSMLQRVVASIAQVHSSAAVVLSNTELADEVSREAQQMSEAVNSAVKDTVEAIGHVAITVKNAAEDMHTLQSHSEKIGTVLEVIKSIAEQTNLLALNAAIEAARAGEQGRGFAVVADEVRQLASRTSASTQEIQQIINNLQLGTQRASAQMLAGAEATEVAVLKAGQAGDSLAVMMAGFATIGERTQAIKSAGQRQNGIVIEVGQSAEQLNDLACQGVDISRESLNTSRQLAHIVAEMKAKLQAFQI